MRVLLLPVFGDQGFEARLAATVLLAREFAAHLIFCAPVAASTDNLRALAEARAGSGGVASTWVEMPRHDAAAFAERAQLTDLLILPARWRPSEPQAPAPADIAVRAPVPALILPQTGLIQIPRVILVAWKERTPAAANALRAALPFLKRANEVVVATIGRDSGRSPDVAPVDYLAWHGISASHRALPRVGPVADTVRAEAERIGADLIVMGAYGRGLWTEQAFGGVTQRLMDGDDIALLLSRA